MNSCELLRVCCLKIILSIGEPVYLLDYASGDNQQRIKWDFQVYVFPAQVRRVPSRREARLFGPGRSELVWFKGYSLRTELDYPYLTHLNVT